MTGADRGRLLWRLADLMERDLETFVALEAHDVGKPAFEPRMVDIPNAIDVFRHFAGWADKIEGRWVTPLPAFGHLRQAYTIREPIGVVGAITAWNAPTLIASWKLGPALAAGNAVVLKPAEDAPLCALYLAALIEEAEFPAGVVSVIPGLGAVAGAALVGHRGVDKISFTGSPEVGREIAIQSRRRVPPVTLELGGKSPQIVLADADLGAALPGIAVGFLANQGEICAAGTRILVARALYDDVVAGLADAARGVILGDPFHPETTMGALINEQAARPRDRLHRAGHCRGRRARDGRRTAGSTGLLRRADGLRRLEQRHRDRAGRDLRARSRSCCRSTTPRTRSRSRTTRATASRPTSGRRTCPRRTGSRRAARRRRLDQRAGRARRAPALGRPQDERHRPRARLGRDRGKHRGEDRHDHAVTGARPVVIVTREEMDERV